MEGVDRMFLHDAIEIVQDIGAAVQPFTSETLIHGDLPFENILWADGITALLDVEWSRHGPTASELAIILRWCDYPPLPDAHKDRKRVVQGEGVSVGVILGGRRII